MAPKEGISALLTVLFTSRLKESQPNGPWFGTQRVSAIVVYIVAMMPESAPLGCVVKTVVIAYTTSLSTNLSMLALNLASPLAQAKGQMGHEGK